MRQREPIIIDVENADLETLRKQCERFDIKVKPTNSAATLRKKLHKYYKQHEQWVKLAYEIFGAYIAQHVSHKYDTVADIHAIISRYLCFTLSHDGYAHPEGKGKPVRDSKKDCELLLLNPKDSRTCIDLNVRMTHGEKVVNGSVTTIHAARCAYSYIDEIFAEWENDCKQPDGN